MMKVFILAGLVAVCIAYPNAIRFDQSFGLQAAQSQSSSSSKFGKQIVSNVLTHADRSARLIDVRSNGAISTEDLKGGLIDNATLIRSNIVGGFDCNGKMYGYYADVLNGCQIFHVCVPLKQLWPDMFTASDIMHFAFICPKYTIFTQDAMVCAWEREAIPCESAPDLYYLNENFFVIPPKGNATQRSGDILRI